MEKGSVHNNNGASGLQWENLGIYGERPDDEHPRVQTDFSMTSSSSSGGGNNVFSKCPIFGASSLEPLDDFVGKLSYLHPYRNVYEDVMRVQQQQQQNNNLGGTISPSGSGEPLTGLRLGRVHKEYGDHSFPHNTSIAANKASASPSSSSIPVSSVPAKRSRASYQNMQNPCCQVEGCNLDLKLAKDYHRRHRICESHSKSPKVIVSGMERRFCQQCSRFHELSEFDDKKRSCRRRLSDHNARRRRVQPESIINNLNPANGMQSSSALYDQRPQSILLNGHPISLSNPTWENARDSSVLIRPKAAGGMDGTPPCFPTNEIVRSSISNLHISSSFHGSGSNLNPPRVLNQCLHVPNSPMAPPDLLSAQSLLSSNSWSLNEGESAASSMEGLINYNNVNNNVMRHTQTAGSCSSSDPHHNLSPFESNTINNHPPAVHESAAAGGGGPAAAVHSINLQDPDNSHLQEFHLFYDPGRFFYSTQRNL